MTSWRTLSFLLATTFFYSSVSSAEIVIVGNHKLPELTKQQVKSIFLKHTTKLTNDIHITPFDLNDNHNLKWSFYENIVGKTQSQVYSYWSRKVFSGIASPPTEVASINVLTDILTNTPGAIGYMDDSNVTSDLKVLYRMNTK